MKKNDKVQITITGMISSGSGVGRYEGMAVFVPLTAVGDVCSVQIVKLQKSYAYGRLLEIITPSKERLENDCVVYNRCGGCTYRHISVQEELRIKKEMVQSSFSKIAGLPVKVEDVLGAQDIYYYRNKAQFPVGKMADGKLNIGFFSQRSHHIIDIDDCKIQEKEFGGIIATIREWVEQNNISVYNEETGKGLLRHIFLRVGKATKEIMVCLVINDEEINKKTRLITQLTEHNKNIKSIVLNINKERSNVILGKSCKTIWGSDFIEDVLGDLHFHISPLSFFQVNPLQTVKLYNKAIELCDLKGTETVLDLYCGIGTISLFLAKKAKKVYGVEIVKEAIEDAKKNAMLNGIENVEFIVRDAGQAAKMLSENGITPDIVVVDPPRKGCESELLDIIVAMEPKKIVYVSCDSATLARDVKLLSEKGYTTNAVHPVDMFPRTAHVECVVLMSRVDK